MILPSAQMVNQNVLKTSDVIQLLVVHSNQLSASL